MSTKKRVASALSSTSMERRRVPGLKTYGRADRRKAKDVQLASKEKDSSVPLMSWNELVNRSDSFDRLIRSSKVYEKVVSVTAGHNSGADGNGRSAKKQRRGLSLRRKYSNKESSPKKHSVGLKRSPMSNPSINSCKPYPPCSPIEVPMDLDDPPKVSHKCKSIYNSFIKVKKTDQEKIVKTLQRILGAEEPPEKGKSMPPDDQVVETETVSRLALSADQCLLTTSATSRNCNANVGFRATSTPAGKSTVSTLQLPSSQVLVPLSDITKKLQSIHHSPNLGNDFIKLQPRVHLVRSITLKHDADGGTCLVSDGSHASLVADKENLVTEMTKTKLQCYRSSSTIPSSLGDEHSKVNQVAILESTQGAIFRSDHQTVKNESEMTTLPIEISLSLTASHLKSCEGLSCTMMQQSLMLLCSQPEILDFETCFPKRQIKKCSKVGEGTYGEVFAVTINTELLILKVVPCEGDFEVNGATMKKMEDIQDEAIVSRELSDLRIGDRCSTFIRLINTYCIKGEYPKTLIKAWQRYHREIGSENENPKVFSTDQLFMVFVYENGGCDLEKYKFAYAAQAKSAFLQICCALAVAEEALQFEHRDLHWGNVLVSKTDSPDIKFKLSKNKPIKISSEGISVRIIDYSICRMNKGKSKIIYTDLSNDDALFTGIGDYQFEVYRMMKVLNNNNWQEYNPKTNVCWLGYILEKLSLKAKCSRGRRGEHKLVIELLQQFKELLPFYDSSLKLVKSMNGETSGKMLKFGISNNSIFMT